MVSSESNLTTSSFTDVDGACQSVVGRNYATSSAACKKDAASDAACKKDAADNASFAAPSKFTAGNASFVAPCPATPQRIASYYDVVPSIQYPRITVPSCIATTCVQKTNYHIMPNSWPRHQLFENNSNISYIKTEQSPVYDNHHSITTLATKQSPL